MSAIINNDLYIHRIHRTGARLVVPTFSKQFATKSTKNDDIPFEEQKPIDYLKSPAAQWKAQYSVAGIKDDSPWIEMWSVLFSVSIFLIYFCILREENDIDEKLKQPLYDHVPGLEETNLLVLHKYNKENNIDNKLIEARMKELGLDLNKI